MMKKQFAKGRRLIRLLLCALCLMALLLPLCAQAEDKQKTVRVGWFESSFNITGTGGRKSGYAYEYQMKISAYTGWNYEYVNGSWPDLMQKLIDGEIDLLSDVSYTDERAERMLFPDLAMGTEEYYIFIAPDNVTITPDDYNTLQGKKIGVNAGSVMVSLYEKWSARHNVSADLIELTTTENESLNKLAAGEIDAYITPNVHVDPSRLLPLCKIGCSDFFFAVNKARPDLLSELNFAMNRIQEENPYYNQSLFEKHVQSFGANAFLSTAEETWLKEHGPVRIGYQDNYLAFCARDKETGQLTGALKDYLDYAADCFRDVHIEFAPVAYPTAAEALAALDRGEVDCIFPVNFGSYEEEERGILMTPSLMRMDVHAVVRIADQKIFNNKEHVVVAVNEGNPNYDSFLADNFPKWRAIYFKSTPECLHAVADGVADCVLISSYRYNNIARYCDKYHLTTYSTGIGLDYFIAVSAGDSILYSILAKASGLIPPSTVNAALSYYIAQDAKMTVFEFLEDNLLYVTIGIAAALFVFIFFLVRSLRAERRAKQLIRSTETDALTGLYNRDYFFEYAGRIYSAQPGIARDAIVVNIEQFHSINALNGWQFGDEVLRALGSEVAAIAKENDGIGGRFGADRFDIYCRHLDDYRAVFDRLQNRLNALAENVSIRLRMGVMPWEAKLAPIQLFDRARTACNMARGHYKDKLIVFDDAIHEREILDQRLLNDLRRALDNYEFEVYYQPKYDISGDTPVLVGAEALIRWRHPELGMLLPDSFIPLFEKNGKVTEVDKYVFEQAARRIARWKHEFGTAVPVSVNLSRVDIFDTTLEQTLDGIFRENGIGKEFIKLEITESAYTENAQQLIRIIESLHQSGYVVEMDDFGTGYSSLNMLSSLPIDVLKMDRSFIRNIEHNEKDVQLVALILGIAKRLQMSVVAEGVENEAQIKILKQLGCTVVQGYYYSPPLHATEFEQKYLHGESGDPEEKES